MSDDAARYLALAKECMRLAEEPELQKHRPALIVVADNWLELAHRASSHSPNEPEIITAVLH